MQYWRVLADQWKSQKGQAIVEMAVLLPLITMMLLGTIDFARVFYTAMAVSHAARAGAQYGVQNNATASDKPGMVQAAKDAAQDLVTLSALTVTAENYCKCTGGTAFVNCMTDNCGLEGVPPLYVKVTAKTTFQTLVNYPRIPHTVNVNRTAIMRVQ